MTAPITDLHRVTLDPAQIKLPRLAHFLPKSLRANSARYAHVDTEYARSMAFRSPFA